MDFIIGACVGFVVGAVVILFAVALGMAAQQADIDAGCDDEE